LGVWSSTWTASSSSSMSSRPPPLPFDCGGPGGAAKAASAGLRCGDGAAALVARRALDAGRCLPLRRRRRQRVADEGPGRWGAKTNEGPSLLGGQYKYPAGPQSAGGPTNIQRPCCIRAGRGPGVRLHRLPFTPFSMARCKGCPGCWGAKASEVLNGLGAAQVRLVCEWRWRWTTPRLRRALQRGGCG
jgi:hypothetical protein